MNDAPLSYRQIVKDGEVIDPNRLTEILPQVSQARQVLDAEKLPKRQITNDFSEHCSGCKRATNRSKLQDWRSKPRPDGSHAVRLLLCPECNANALRAEAITNRNYNPTQATATNQKGRTTKPSAVRPGRTQG